MTTPTFYNFTMVDVTLKKTDGAFLTFRPQKSALRCFEHDADPCESIWDIPTKWAGKYDIRVDGDMDEYSFNDGDVVIVSLVFAQALIGHRLYDEYFKNKVIVCAPGSGPGDTVRDETGKILYSINLKRYI